jgi:hypothetical protein
MNAYEYQMYQQARENHNRGKPCPFCVEASQECWWRETRQRNRTPAHNAMCAKCPHAHRVGIFDPCPWPQVPMSCVSLGTRELVRWENSEIDSRLI